MGYSFRLTSRVLLYAPSHRQDSTYHGLCYTSRGALAGTRNISMGPPHEGSIRRPVAPWANALTTELHIAPVSEYQHIELLALASLAIRNLKAYVCTRPNQVHYLWEDWTNECLTTPQHKNKIGYWVSNCEKTATPGYSNWGWGTSPGTTGLDHLFIHVFTDHYFSCFFVH